MAYRKWDKTTFMSDVSLSISAKPYSLMATTASAIIIAAFCTLANLHTVEVLESIKANLNCCFLRPCQPKLCDSPLFQGENGVVVVKASVFCAAVVLHWVAESTWIKGRCTSLIYHKAILYHDRSPMDTFKMRFKWKQ